MKEDLLFGRIALLNNIITKEQLEEAVNTQKKNTPLRSLGFILKEKGQIKINQIKAILQAQKKNLPRPVKSPEERKEDMAFGYIAFRHEYLSIEVIVKCLKLQGDIAKKGLLFRLSEILYNENFLLFKEIEEVFHLQQQKILPCSSCETPYNIVGLPANARFPCRKCQEIVEIPKELAAEDESDRLEQYKIDIEEGIRKVQELKEVVMERVESEEEEEEEEEEFLDIDEQKQESTETHEKENVKDSRDIDASNDVEETSSQVEKETEADEEFIKNDIDAEYEFTEENEETLSKETKTIADEFTDSSEFLENEFDDFSKSKANKSTESQEEIEEPFLSSKTMKKSTPEFREISLDDDELHGQEMPNLEEVTAKAIAKIKNAYENKQKRKDAFFIKTTDLNFFPEEISFDKDNLEIKSLQSLASFEEDEFIVNESAFVEQTVHSKEEEEIFEINTSERFSFDDNIETRSEDDMTFHKSIRKRQTRSVSKNKKTQIIKMNLDTSDEDIDGLFEDEMISIGPHLLKKYKKHKKK